MNKININKSDLKYCIARTPIVTSLKYVKNKPIALVAVISLVLLVSWSSPLLGLMDLVGNQYEASAATLPDFSFAAAGDWGCNSNAANTASNIQGKKTDITLADGDLSYSTTADCWFDAVSPLNSQIRMGFGNHDTTSLLKSQYMDHFGLTKQYYSFDYQNVHFLSVSSEISYKVGSDQYNFVKNDLEKAASDPTINWTIVFHHRTEYNSSSITAPEASLRDTLHPLFQQYGVDIVIQGHIHNYERTYPLQYNTESPSNPIIVDTDSNDYSNPDGPIFITVGTGV